MNEHYNDSLNSIGLKFNIDTNYIITNIISYLQSNENDNYWQINHFYVSLQILNETKIMKYCKLSNTYMERHSRCYYCAFKDIPDDKKYCINCKSITCKSHNYCNHCKLCNNNNSHNYCEHCHICCDFKHFKCNNCNYCGHYKHYYCNICNDCSQYKHYDCYNCNHCFLDKHTYCKDCNRCILNEYHNCN
jgi:hypothetical protein